MNTMKKKNTMSTMKLTSKLTASAAALFTVALFAMAGPTSANAADYCITNGAQAAHGCGYPTMETCRAASAGIGGSCSPSGAARTNDSDLGNSMAQQRQTQMRGHVRQVPR